MFAEWVPVDQHKSLIPFLNLTEVKGLRSSDVSQFQRTAPEYLTRLKNKLKKKAIDILLLKFYVLTWTSWTSKTLFTLLLNICTTLEIDYCEQLYLFVTFYQDHQESVS